MGAAKNAGGELKKPDSGKKGGADSRISVVLKADFHCEGCVSKIVKAIRACDGVEDVKVDGATSKLTVTGKVDPAALREKVEAKTHRKVTVVSPEPSNKGGGGDKVKDGGEKDKKKNNNKMKDGKTVEDSKGDDNDKKKEKDKPVAVVATAVLRMNLHCEGCIQKIQRIVSKTKGCQEVKMDKQKETVTVTGTMDVKALTESLKKHLKREVEVVAPPKKEGGEKKEKGGGGEKEKGKGGGKKEGGGGGGGEKSKAVEEANKMQVQVGYPYVYGPGYVVDPIYYNYPPAPQMFSDENPNACTIM
ncbi:unnamed protein product [Cuscuta campestris]|uniref:HMA domain-containing protein n=1 Tax=Cuscuta campestris TaxID=132261 RepID=A0A484KTC3_9ASTE|nr:unnamed protein product [Cuscuta campestris]